MKLRSMVVALCVAGVTLLGSGAWAQQTWKVRGGDVSVGLLKSLMGDLGIPVQKINASAEPSAVMEQAFGLAINGGSDLVIEADQGRILRFVNGAIRLNGGFSFGGQRVLSLNNPVLESNGSDPALGFRVSSRAVSFDLRHGGVSLNPYSRQLTISFADISISQAAARALGRADLAGQLIGTISVTANLELISGKVEPPPIFGPGEGNEPQNEEPVDCQLFAISGLTSLGRLGAFPNGRNGLSMVTTACNVGSRPILWIAPMDTRHPVIAMNLYRILDNRFEHIGLSWLKHGFLSTNSPGCGTCIPPPMGGQQLGINCTDTYGTGNNGDRQWLGERKEVNPFTGKWECRNSYFSDYQNDCVRRRPRSGEFNNDPVSHRLEVSDANLNVTGATFYYEAYYIVDNDYDKYNNIGYRQATATWTGSQWSFSTISNLVRAPALTVWDPNAQIATPRTEGDVWVGRRVLNLGGGVYRYLYAVYVHNLDRQIREFSVPILAGANVTNIRFRDVDGDAGNNWQSAYSNGMITWWTDTHQQNQNANSLKYSTVFNFEFDADVAPAANAGPVSLGQFKPGDVAYKLRANVSTPLAGVVTPNTFQVLFGALQSGGLIDLHDADSQRVVVREASPLALGLPSTNVEFVSTASIPNPSALTVTLVTNTSAAPAGNVTMSTRAFDYVANSWVQVDSRPATAGDSTIEINLANPSRFIEPGTMQVKIRVSMFDPGTLFSFGWQSRFDQVKWTITR